MIRKATEDDIPLIIGDLGQRFHAKSREIAEIHRPTAIAVMRAFVHARDKLFIVSEHDEHLRGLLMAAVEQYWFADPQRGRRYVTDWAFYSEIKGDGILMLKAMTEWAWMQPRVVEVKCATQVPKGRGVVDRLFSSAGFTRVGGMYNMRKPSGD